MKICPQCRKVFTVDVNFCLEDGVMLNNYNAGDPEQTLAYSNDATLQYHSQGPTRDNRAGAAGTVTQNRPIFGQSFQKLDRPNFFLIIGSALGIIILVASGIAGGLMYLRNTVRRDNWEPTPTPLRRYTPYRLMNTDSKEKLKIEVVEKVQGQFGFQYLKCSVTNLSDNIIERPDLTISYFEKEIKVDTQNENLPLDYLKPKQTVPVWVRIRTDKKYDTTKATEGPFIRIASKDEKTLFPAVILTETRMVTEKKISKFNSRPYADNFYIVSGIIENKGDTKISPKIFVIYYDEKSEIVGYASVYVSDLKKGEKAKFEAQAGGSDLFGTPQTFEIVTTD